MNQLKSQAKAATLAHRRRVPTRSKPDDDGKRPLSSSDSARAEELLSTSTQHWRATTAYLLAPTQRALDAFFPFDQSQEVS